MDTLTHALSAMLVARASRPATLRQGQLSLPARSWAGFFAGAFPDSDFIAMLFGTTTYLHYHRGITHSLILMPLWAGLLAWLFSLLSRRRYSWRAFYEVCLLGILVHIFGDVITNYGTMVFAPFSRYKLALSTTFIIDWYFSGIIVLGLLFSYTSKHYKKQFALAGFCLLLGYVLAQSWWRHMAKQEVARGMPRAILQHATAHILPQPVSPFNWKLVLALPDRYYVRYINLFRDKPAKVSADANFLARIDALYLPRRDDNWQRISRYGPAATQNLAQRIWAAPAMAELREFMQLPAVQQVQTSAQATCVWFADQRFVLRGLRAPFMFGGCKDKANGKITIMHMADDKPQALNASPFR